MQKQQQQKQQQQPKRNLRVHTRWMIARDLPEVVATEAAGFGLDAWTEQDFLTNLRHRNCIGMVAEHGDIVVGHMIYELHPTLLRVLDLAVHPDYRRCGVGLTMVRKLQSKLESHRKRTLVIDVPERMLDALLFLRRCGFRATEVVRGAYGDDEDGIVLEYQR